MAEETIWRGRSSQWKNAGRFVFAGLIAVLIVGLYFVATAFFFPKIPGARAHGPSFATFAPLILLLLIVPAAMALKAYLQTNSRIYELTNERLKTTRGVFSKVTDTLELYRVKDIETRQPFIYRMAGLENVQLNTSDASSPFILIDAIHSTVGLGDKLRNQVEIIRQLKRVRELDIE